MAIYLQTHAKPGRAGTPAEGARWSWRLPRKPLAWLIGMVVMFAAMGTTSVSAQFAGAGHRNMACIDCHTTSKPERGEAPLRASQEKLCANCHRGSTEASHPVGITPNRPLPADFPVDDAGKITCATCHDFHGERRGLLRVAKSGREFCLSCHENSFFATMADKGASIVMSGHLNAGTEGLFKIAPYAFQCATCHQEKLNEHGGRQRLPQMARAGNHPVGAKYTEAAGFGGYRPVALINSEVLLPDGRLSCVSCHRPYAREHGAAPRTRTGLCAECHAL